ncbi:hypothetical protein BHU72_01255 [Desulfuribacillus stibiiarsenatis]|uniref:Peptidase M1 membrane alanine aminopeptidase domain-containing protein n=1 Tax=Desulfuribacillus stibiiarsenatis TaxID=1390249 RepID=A0A1E5L9V9_9FIRM|nr:M1 family aminopeptidase [Desulfuribacillus stibiiarsenatis]OEH86917.1 hypothetical protein BHU72_01255 [Desulfuribacillus stibiiarsenatis]
MSIIVIASISTYHLYTKYEINLFTYISENIFKRHEQTLPTPDDIIESELDLEYNTNGLERPHYIVKAQLDERKAEINGHVTLKIKKPTTETLAFYNFSPGNMQNMDILQVSLNNSATSFDFRNNKLTVALKQGLFPSKVETIEVEITFRTRVPRMGTRFGVKDDIWLLTTWYPILGTLDENMQWIARPTPVGYGDPFYFQYADYDVYLLCAPDIQWVTTGSLVSEGTQEQLKKYHWQESMVRNFAMVGSKHYTIYEFPTDDDVTIQIALNGNQRLEEVQDIIEYCYPLYKDVFGKLPYRTISIAETSWGTNFALEYPNIAIYSKDLYQQNILERWLPHEFAHIWWYNAVGNQEITEGWIDEGLVEHAVVLYLETRYGSGRAQQLRNYFRTKNQQLIAQKPNAMMNRTLMNFANRNEFFDFWYYRSADMFLTLREELGEIKYNYFLRTLFDNYKGQTIGIEDLNSTLRDTLKGQHQYFQQWVTGPLQQTPFQLQATPLPIKLNGHHLSTEQVRYIDWEVYIPLSILEDILFKRIGSPLTIDESNGQIYYEQQLTFSLPAHELNGTWWIPLELLKHISTTQYTWDYDRNLGTINVMYLN